MKVWKKWAVTTGAACIAVLLIAALAVAWWLPSDDELALLFTAEAQEALGVKVSIGSVHWTMLPTRSITVNEFRTQQALPIVVGKLRAYPNMRMLLHRQLVIERMEVDDATVPSNALHALHVKPDMGEHYAGDGALLEHAAFRNLTWISYSGIATTYDGEIDFDPHWRPRHAELRRPGIAPPFTLTVAREADTDRWQTRIFVGGGTALGQVVLKTAEDGAMRLSGQLAPRDIEVARALSAFNRTSPMAGKGTGQTVLSADGTSLGELTRALHTHTTFSVNAATVLRFDLDKAISTRGKEHDGQTHLQELTGQLDTQNGAEGMRATGSGIRARAGKYTATGQGTVYHGQIQASGTVDLVEGAIGVPFRLNGPVQKPKVSVPPGFFAGAAIGTAVLPGIGTAIGARIGGALGKVFEHDTPARTTKKIGGAQK